MTDNIARPGDVQAPPQEAPPAAGHNQPPPYDPEKMTALRSEIDQFAEAAGQWLDLEKITSEAEAEGLNDFISQARKKLTAVEKARKDTKQPHIDAGKAVDAAFKVPADILDRAVKKARALMTPWLEKKDAERRAEQERQRQEAAEKQRIADEQAAAAAARNDVAGEAEAEALKKEADKEAKAAAKPVKAHVRSASGGGRTMAMRTVREVSVTNIRALFMHYQNHPDVADCLRRLAQADVRAVDVDHSVIPGIEITERKVAA